MAPLVYVVSTLINLTNRFSNAVPERDMFVRLPEACNFQLEADNAEAVLEKAFELGNRQSVDHHGKSWPSNVRSLSTGDIVRVHGNGPARLFAVERTGWREVTDLLGEIHVVEDLKATRLLADQFHAASAPRA